MNRLPPDPRRGVETLAEEQDEFTNEGAPPPGAVGTDLPGADRVPAGAPTAAKRPILTLRPAASLKRRAMAASAMSP
jgi:hypothetical protein